MSDRRGIEATLVLKKNLAAREIRLESYLDQAAEEGAVRDSSAWIKSLRHARIDGVPFRTRFTYRGDSLWWFSELYLHKEHVVLSVFRAIRAIETLLDREAPSAIAIGDCDRIVRFVLPRMTAARGVACSPTGVNGAHVRRAALETRARWLHLSARAARRRFSPPSSQAGRPEVLAFVHRAFWPADAAHGGADTYIGPVLASLEAQVGAGRVRYVSVGPSSNFSGRRWWHALRPGGQAGLATPIEAFAPTDRLGGSDQIWRTRQSARRALWRSADLQAASEIHGVDCWPLVREEFAGIALLQWPWSARAMDEAGAALDAVQPSATLTYAESGGWGRAIALECRRRGVPLAGIQHGFIYGSWLNYLHEADEMEPDPDNPSDRGFPRPALTLLFDEHAAQHLAGAGHYPRQTLRVTGSPRLEALVASVEKLSQADVASVRASLGVPAGDLVLVATKFREARRVLERLVDAAQRLPDARLIIKTHPAETPETYNDIAAGQSHVSVVPASAPLAPLLKAAKAVVTVNSTVALDAAVLDIPALVIGLPNNLTPFVDAGAMAGASAGDLEPALRRILYDCAFRQELQRARREFLSRFGIGAAGDASERAAEAILELCRRGASRPGRS